MEKSEHPVKVLMRPIVPLLEKRMEEMLVMAYEEGYKDGKASWQIPLSEERKKQYYAQKKENKK